MHIRLRIDEVTTLDELTSFLRVYKSVLLVHHILPHGNPHYHAYIDASNNTIGIEAIRNRLKKQFILPPGSYSLKKCDPDRVNEYVQYLFNTKHGNKWSISFVHNFDNATIEQCQVLANTVSEEYKSSKGKSTITMYQLAEEVASLMEETHKDKTIENYVLASVSVCRRHRKAFCKFTLAKIISTARDDEALVKTMQDYFKEL